MKIDKTLQQGLFKCDCGHMFTAFLNDNDFSNIECPKCGAKVEENKK